MALNRRFNLLLAIAQEALERLPNRSVRPLQAWPSAETGRQRPKTVNVCTLLFRDQTGIKLILQHRPVDTGADENNFLTPVAERLGPVIPDIVPEWRMVRPALFRD